MKTNYKVAIALVAGAAIGAAAIQGLHRSDLLLPRIVDHNVLTLDKSGLLQTLLKRGHKMFRTRSQLTAEEPDHRHCRLLRARRERPYHY